MNYKNFTYKKTNEGIVITGYNGDDRDLVIPAKIKGVKVVQIGGWTFAYNNLETVQIPDSVEHIGDWAFSYNNLETVQIPDSVEEIRYRAFSYNNLETVQIPDSVREIGVWAFNNNNLKTVEIPDSVEKIGDWAFDRNENITKITWGDTSYDVRCIDSFCMIIASAKKRGDYQIMRCRFFGGGFEKCYVAEKDGYFAHGDTAKEAVEGCNFKIMAEKRDKSDVVAEIREKGAINPVEYHLLTGACNKMIRRFCEENGIELDEEVEIQKAAALTKGKYGHEQMKEVLKVEAL